MAGWYGSTDVDDEDGVADGDRTRDNRSHSPALYQLSYSHHNGRGGGIRTPDILLPKQARYQTALHPEVAESRASPREARILLRCSSRVNYASTVFSHTPVSVTLAPHLPPRRTI